MKYAKLINETAVEFPPKNKDNIINYNLNETRLILDGYKEFIEAQKQTGKSYTITYRQEDTQIIETAQEIIPDPIEILIEKKQAKIKENDTKRDIALNQGVVYNEVLFDSDTDQKVNLLAVVSSMNDEDTIIWYGMNNYSLECSKSDLINIGSLITQLHVFCWTKNAQIKETISQADTIEALDLIEIDYSMPATESEEN